MSGSTDSVIQNNSSTNSVDVHGNNTTIDTGNNTNTTIDTGNEGARVFATELVAGNNSGVHGAAIFTLQDNVLTADIHATGLEPGEVHPQHIHGFENNDPSQQPNLTFDGDHDGFIEDQNLEAENAAGPVILALTESGTPTSDEHAPGFPVVGQDGVLNFHHSYEFDTNDPEQAQILAALQSLGNRALELHGESVPAGEGAGTSGEVDGTGGYKEDLPVASGLIHEVTDTTTAGALERALANHDDVSHLVASLDQDQKLVHDLDSSCFSFGHS